jgi:hypothetical protein
MLRSGDFWVGVIAGAAVVWVYHHFVSPLPAPKGA